MSTANPLRILFAEDEESFQSSLSHYLTEMGFIVNSVATGEDAIATLGERDFDVIILDYKMPGISGLNVLQWMLEQKRETPAIVLTGEGSEHIAAEAMKLGAYDYVVKNQVDLHHFPIIINGVYERYLFRKEREAKNKTLQNREDMRISIEPIERAVVSLSHVTNNSLTLLSLNLQDYVRDYVVPYLTPETQQHSQAALEEIKKDIDVINSTIKSMLNLTSAMQHKLSGEIWSASVEEAILQGTDVVMKEHKARMEK